MSSNRWGAFLFAEFVFIFSFVFLFALAYVFFFGAPVSVLFPHVLAVFSFWLFLLGVRVVSWRWGTFLGRFQRFVAGVLFVVPVFLLFFWYCAAMLGLLSWGKIITWQMFVVYFSQFESFSAVLGLSVGFLYAAASALVVGLLVLVFMVFRVDGVAGGAKSFSTLGAFLLSILCFALGVSQFLALPIIAEKTPQEPFSVTFFSSQVSKLQSHLVSISPVLVQSEEMARAKYKPTPQFNGRNVILIVGDALRSSHMSVYGYPRKTTPFLEKGAREFGVHVFPVARSICAESFCGLLGLATSRYLHQIPSEPLSLYEVLRKHNYSVSLVLSGDHTNFYGLKNAYGEVDSYFDGTGQQKRYINDDELLVDYVESLPVYDGSQPKMFQFHLMSAHGVGMRHENSEYQPMTNYYRWSAGRVLKAPSSRAVSEAVNYYDNGVVKFDRVVDSLLSQLSVKGYLENAVVVVTGDHGEMLGEKGFFGHQYRTDEEVLDIPLIIQRRGYTGSPFAGWPLVSQVDVAPTILHELNIESPSVWKGVALQKTVHSRKVYFQQAPSVGLYSVLLSGPIAKYSVDSASGSESIEFLHGVGASNSSGSVDSSILGGWRRDVKKTVVLSRESTDRGMVDNP